MLGLQKVVVQHFELQIFMSATTHCSWAFGGARATRSSICLMCWLCAHTLKPKLQ